MYRMGRGVSQDMNQSWYWMLKSAEGGYMPAQYDVGAGYMSSERNIEAYRWLLLAVNNGSSGARDALRSLENRMSRSEIDEAKRLAAASSNSPPTSSSKPRASE